MRYAIFSDMHGNLQAYTAFMEDARKENIDKYYCAGDIVGYGANPHECIELTKELRCPVVCGNHDWAVADKLDITYFVEYAKAAIVWTKDNLGDIDKNYLGNLGLVYQDNELTIVHGTLIHPEDFDYVWDETIAAKSMHILKTQLLFVGHTHSPGIFYEDYFGYVRYTTNPGLTINKSGRYLVDVGSIGQPRDRDRRSSYCIYDNENATLCIKRIGHDIRT
jgi:predicted phosphodiesterase